jgi:NAD(P)-dependent dehydrogenase (short-subunit alcohol dehydrogenase family)
VPLWLRAEPGMQASQTKRDSQQSALGGTRKQHVSPLCDKRPKQNTLSSGTELAPAYTRPWKATRWVNYGVALHVRQELTQRGAEVLAVPCDVTDQEWGRSLVDQAIQRFGRVDIVVNKAGIIQVGPMSTTTVEDFANALDVVFWATLYPTLAVLPQMRARRSGHVVNITSIGGMVSVPHLLPYSCAKFAAVGL